MPASDFQKKAVYFVAFSGTVILILLIIAFVESFLQDYLLAQFGLNVTPDGRIVPSDGTPPGMMTETSVSLVVNIFHLIKIFLWMALIIAIVRFVSYFIFTTVYRGAAQSEISSLVRTILSIVVYIVSFFIIFQSQYPDVQLAPLFTGSTIVGIVVGLALQDTLGNLFSGIALQADKPFQAGDVVSISGRGQGVVEAVSWRGVKIRTFQNKLLVLSNSVMGKETIEVGPRDNLNARLVFFSTLYSDSPARTAQLVRETVRQVENVSAKIRPIVRIRDLGDHGIDWEVKYWAEDYTKFNDTDALIRQRIWYLFKRENIGFPFPTRTVHIEQRPEETTREEFVDTTSEYLGRIPIFAPLSEEELGKLAETSEKRVFAPGEAIVRKGREGNSMFVIMHGGVNVQIPDDRGMKTVNTLRQNDFFGEMSLLTGEPRSATVVATEETEVLQIKKTALKPIFDENPELVKAICDIIEERRVLLSAEDEEAAHITDPGGRGVMASIRRFFGMD